MKRPEPWYREERDAWYICLHGKQVPLKVKGIDNKPAAYEVFYKIMAREGQAPPPKDLTIGELVAKFRAWSQSEHAESTQVFYESHLVPFLAYKPIAKKKADALTPSDVSAWIAARKVMPQKRKKPLEPGEEIRKPRPLSQSTKRQAITVIKALYSFAEKNCGIRNDKIRHMERPPMGKRKAATEEQRTSILNAVQDEPFQNYLTVVTECGCRPGEAMRLTAEMIRFEEGIIAFYGKTSGETGKDRIIFMTDRLRELLRKLAAEHPTGPLLLNTDGKPWDRNAVRCRFRRLRAKLKMKGVVCYSLRHSYVTDALEAGVPIAQVAQLAGHQDTKMISEVYSHLQERREHMREQAEKATRKDSK